MAKKPKRDTRVRKTRRKEGMPVEGLKTRLDDAYGKGAAVTEEKSGSGAGRPKKFVDKRILAGLCAIQCTLSEMAAVIGVDQQTLTDKYADLIEQEREAGKMSIRRAQFTSGLNGSVPMLIWLGKQYLGQREKLEQSVPVGELPIFVMRAATMLAP